MLNPPIGKANAAVDESTYVDHEIKHNTSYILGYMLASIALATENW